MTILWQKSADFWQHNSLFLAKTQISG